MLEEKRQDGGWPPPLMTSETGSFAQKTIVERKPQIIAQIIADNDYEPRIVKALERYRKEIATQPMRPLSENAPDAASWNKALVQHSGKTWLEVPWYFAEAFFYRRLLEAVGYFQPGPRESHDPFEKGKQAQVKVASEQLAEGWGQLSNASPDVAFEALLHSSLWGNRADLSNYTVRLRTRGGLAAREERRNLVIDNTDQVQTLLEPGVTRIDFINDNVGLEMLFDLAFADFLLTREWTREVVFHLKNWPFFVSDAMGKDVHATLSLLCAWPDVAVAELGARLQEHRASDRMILKDSLFWTSSLMFFEMPPSLQADLARSDLVILKGDVNYRRLLGDRHWPYTTRLETVAAYFPAPLLVLRTLKGEIIVGLEEDQAEQMAAADPTWLINGRRGIIQLVAGARVD